MFQRVHRCPSATTGFPRSAGELFDTVRRRGFAVEEIDVDEPICAIAARVLGPDRQVWDALDD